MADPAIRVILSWKEQGSERPLETAVATSGRSLSSLWVQWNRLEYCTGGGRRVLAQGRDNFSFLECLFHRYSRPYMMELEEVIWANTRPAKRCNATCIGLIGQKIFRNGVCAAQNVQNQIIYSSCTPQSQSSWISNGEIWHLTYSGHFHKPVEEIYWL